MTLNYYNETLRNHVGNTRNRATKLKNMLTNGIKLDSLGDMAVGEMNLHSK